jgi:CBS domain-containing protein
MHRLRDILREHKLNFVERGETVAEVARRMAALNVGAILVLEDGKLSGIFSERDLMTRVVVEGKDPNLTPVESVMSTSIATVEESATVEEAMTLMHDHKCRHLPMLRQGQVVVMVSMRDLMNFELELKTDEIRHMRAYIQESTH